MACHSGANGVLREKSHARPLRHLLVRLLLWVDSPLIWGDNRHDHIFAVESTGHGVKVRHESRDLQRSDLHVHALPYFVLQ